jgi:hypothetical protein
MIDIQQAFGVFLIQLALHQPLMQVLVGQRRIQRADPIVSESRGQQVFGGIRSRPTGYYYYKILSYTV